MLIVTADHGQCPLPDSEGGVRLDPVQLERVVEEEFGAGLGESVLSVVPSEIYLYPEVLRDAGASTADVAAFLRHLPYRRTIGPYVPASAIEQDLLDREEFAAVFATSYLDELHDATRFGEGTRPWRRRGPGDPRAARTGRLNRRRHRPLHGFPAEEPPEPHQDEAVAGDRLADALEREQRLQHRVAGCHRRALGDDARTRHGRLERSRARIGREPAAGPQTDASTSAAWPRVDSAIGAGAQVQPRPVPMQIDRADRLDLQQTVERLGRCRRRARDDRLRRERHVDVEPEQGGVRRVLQSPAGHAGDGGRCSPW